MVKIKSERIGKYKINFARNYMSEDYQVAIEYKQPRSNSILILDTENVSSKEEGMSWARERIKMALKD